MLSLVYVAVWFWFLFLFFHLGYVSLFIEEIGYLNYRTSHSLDFTGCISMALFSMLLCPLHFLQIDSEMKSFIEFRHFGEGVYKE
jgi:hypothetical protein